MSHKMKLMPLLIPALMAGLISCGDKKGGDYALIDRATARDFTERQRLAKDGSLPMTLMSAGQLPEEDVTMNYGYDMTAGNVILVQSAAGREAPTAIGGIKCPPRCFDSSTVVIEPPSPPPPPDSPRPPALKIIEPQKLSEAQITEAYANFKASFPCAAHSFDLTKDAVQWLKSNKASIVKVMPARDADNKRLVLLAPYDEKGTQTGDDRYFVLKKVSAKACK